MKQAEPTAASESMHNEMSTGYEEKFSSSRSFDSASGDRWSCSTGTSYSWWGGSLNANPEVANVLESVGIVLSLGVLGCLEPALVSLVLLISMGVTGISWGPPAGSAGG